MHRTPEGPVSTPKAAGSGTPAGRRTGHVPSTLRGEVGRARTRYLDLLRDRIRAGTYPDDRSEALALERLLYALLADRAC